MNRLKNILLIIRFPFLLPRRWGDKVNDWDLIKADLKEHRFKDVFNDLYTFDYTELDFMPDGWRRAFGIKLCKDIKKALGIYLYTWRILEIKEKFGALRIYSNFTTNKLSEVFCYYEDLSMCYCQFCGSPVRYVTPGWITYLCERCIYDMYNKDVSKYKLTKEDIPKRYVIRGKKTIYSEPDVNFKKLWGLDD